MPTKKTDPSEASTERADPQLETAREGQPFEVLTEEDRTGWRAVHRVTAASFSDAQAMVEEAHREALPSVRVIGVAAAGNGLGSGDPVRPVNAPESA